MRSLKLQEKFTERNDQSLNQYLAEISNIPMIDASEEIRLAQCIRQGDEKALEKLVNSNLRFVVSVAKQYQNKGLNLGDLVNEGNIGLIKAANKFDESRGFKFISYAVWWIRQSILQSLSDNGRIVRIPSNKISTMNRIVKKIDQLTQKFEYEPSFEEISDALEDVDVDEIFKLTSHYQKHTSLNSFISEKEGTEVLDILNLDTGETPDSYLMIESLKHEINSAFSVLKEDEKIILKMFYGFDTKIPMTLEEISNKLNKTRERVRQIREKALRKLRKAQKDKKVSLL